MSPTTLLIALLASGCSVFTGHKEEAAEVAAPDPTIAEPAPTAAAAPERRGPRGRHGQANSYEITARVLNPTSNVELAVYQFMPDGAGPFPTLLVLPGGIKAGYQALRPQGITTYMETGFGLILFDPDGRGESGGTEDMGGTIHQDGLAAVLEWAVTADRVDPARIGVFSSSYSITMAAGCLARHDTAARFLIDYEGPASRKYSNGCPGSLPHGTDMPFGACDDDEWWSTREAVNFIDELTIPYLRIQFDRDHAQETHMHTVDMVQSAMKGGVPWVRVNTMPVNKTISGEADIDYLTRAGRGDPLIPIAPLAKELMEEVSGQPVLPGQVPAGFSAGGPPGRGGGGGGGGGAARGGRGGFQPQKGAKRGRGQQGSR